MDSHALAESLIKAALKTYGPARICAMAQARQGYGSGDAGFTLCYPEEADPPAWLIPAGSLEIWIGWHDVRDEFPEADYLKILERLLRAGGAAEEAGRVAAFRAG